MLYNNWLLDPFALITKPSVYVISDSQLAEYKQKQTEAEVAELDRLIEGHESSIARIKEARENILNSLKLSAGEQPE